MDFFTLLIILFVVSRIVEAVRGQGTQPPKVPPGQRQGRPRPPGQLPRQPRPRVEEPGTATPGSSGADRAAGMIPDELWEILTGEKRQPRPVPAPAPSAPPAPEREPEEEGFDPWAEGLARDEEVAERPRPPTVRDEDSEVDRLLARRRAELADRAPERTSRVVSLFKEPPPPDIRHARFHRRIEALEEAPAQARPAAARRLGLERPGDLRRAFILAEVLGRPKALEESGGPG